MEIHLILVGIYQQISHGDLLVYRRVSLLLWEQDSSHKVNEEATKGLWTKEFFLFSTQQVRRCWKSMLFFPMFVQISWCLSRIPQTFGRYKNLGFILRNQKNGLFSVDLNMVHCLARENSFLTFTTTSHEGRMELFQRNSQDLKFRDDVFSGGIQGWNPTQVFLGQHNKPL